MRSLLDPYGIVSSDPATHLRTKNTELQKANADLSEQVEHLEVIVKELYAEIEIKDKAICLYSEAIKHSEERDRLLGRIKALTQK